MVLLAIVAGIASAQESHQLKDGKEKLAALVGSYVLDPAAVVQERTGPMPFKTPDDPSVCKLYLENLNHFAKKGRSLACERLIAPHLAQRIRKIEWVNLDPEEYPTLFQEAVSVTRYGGSQPATEEDLRQAREQMKAGAFVFRRTKKSLFGRLIAADTVNGVYRHISIPDAPIDYYLLQAGHYFCQSDDRQTNLFQAPLSLEFVYSGFVVQHSNLIGNELVKINDRLYAELVRENRSIELQEFDSRYPTMLNSVCLFKFKPSARKGK